jgi:hypothetical protein
MGMRRHSRSSSALILAIGCSLHWPLGRALAEVNPAADASAKAAEGTASGKAEARAHFERGVQLGHAGDYQEAAAEFQRAYQISPHYAVLYNLAQAQIALGQPVEAIDTLRRYLLEGGANVPADRRAEVQDTIKQQEARVSTLTVETNVAGAAIVVDGVSVARSPLAGPLRVARGKHQVTAALDGYRARSQTITADENAQVSIQLEPVTAPADSSGPLHALVAGSAAQPDRGPLLLTQSPGPDAEPATRAHRRRTIGVVAGGIGVAMGAAALGCYLWNKSRFDAYESARVNDGDKADSIRTVSAVTVGLAIGSGALVATGVVLVLTAPAGSTTSPHAGLTAGSAVAIGARGISWRTTW